MEGRKEECRVWEGRRTWRVRRGRLREEGQETVEVGRGGDIT